MVKTTYCQFDGHHSLEVQGQVTLKDSGRTGEVFQGRQELRSERSRRRTTSVCLHVRHAGFL